MAKRGREKEGLTLVEVLMAVTLGALVLMGLAAAAGNIFQLYGWGRNEMSQSRDLASAMDRILWTVRTSADARSGGPHDLILEDPAGLQTRCTWSGAVGDPLTEQTGAGNVHPFLEGVKDFTFLIHAGQITGEQVSSTDQQQFFFDHYPLGGEEWRFLTLGANDRYGIEFILRAGVPVEAIRLQELKLRLAVWWDQPADLRIRLFETVAATVPRPYGPALAVLDIPNADIPWTSDPWNNIGWMTIDLPGAFTVISNRRYCLMIQSLGPGEAGYLRFRRHEGYYESGTDPSVLGPGAHQDIRMLVSHDAGATVYPAPGSHEIHFEDIPVQLHGETVTLTVFQEEVKTCVDVSLSVERSGTALGLTKREYLLGGIHGP